MGARSARVLRRRLVRRRPPLNRLPSLHFCNILRSYGHVAICAEDSNAIFSTDLPIKGKPSGTMWKAFQIVGFAIICHAGYLVAEDRL